MGCDIHTTVEVKKEGKWEAIEETLKIFNRRNYQLFSIFANVRNSWNTKYISEPKGLPKDASKEAKKYDGDPDYHSHSFLTLKEIQDFDKSDYFTDKYSIPADFYKYFKENGGKLPEGVYIEKERKASDLRTAIQEAFSPTVIAVVPIKPSGETPLEKGLAEFEELATKAKASAENIRMVFCFDN